MAKPSRFQSHHSSTLNSHHSAVEFADVLAVDVSAFHTFSTVGAELATCSSFCVRLDLEDLDCFETVADQYQQLGVTFNNAIALCPSNPSFPPYSGSKVLLGAPKNGLIEATFRDPVHHVSGFITGSRRVVMAAYDDQDQLIAQTSTSGANLAGGDADAQPNQQLSLNMANIQRVSFYACDGQLTLDDFAFSC